MSFCFVSPRNAFVVVAANPADALRERDDATDTRFGFFSFSFLFRLFISRARVFRNGKRVTGIVKRRAAGVTLKRSDASSSRVTRSSVCKEWCSFSLFQCYVSTVPTTKSGFLPPPRTVNRLPPFSSSLAFYVSFGGAFPPVEKSSRVLRSLAREGECFFEGFFREGYDRPTTEDTPNDSACVHHDYADFVFSVSLFFPLFGGCLILLP